MSQTKAYLVSISLLFAFAFPVFAAPKTVVPFTAEQAAAGFEARLKTGELTITFLKKGLPGKGSLSLRPVRDGEFPPKPFATRVSGMAEYHINSSRKGELAKPLTITLPLADDAEGTIRINYYDKRGKVWRPIQSSVDEDAGTASATTRFAFSVVAAFRDEALRVRLTKNEAKKGTVIESPDGNFTLDVPEKALDRKADIIVKRFEAMSEFGFPKGTEMVSPAIYEYAIRGDKLKIGGPVRITLAFTPVSDASVSVFALDKKNRVWKKLPSTAEEERVSVETKLAYAPLVVLKEDTAFEGAASWYSGNEVTDAATNHFPVGTKVKVTNVETGASTEVTVVSTWKGVSGRVIDLTRSAFQKIAKLGAGVVRVRIEKI